jgi:hypothetical protein
MTASTTAAPPSRTSTVPVADQPASIRALANGPYSPKVTAETTAKANPAPTVDGPGLTRGRYVELTPGVPPPKLNGKRG